MGGGGCAPQLLWQRRMRRRNRSLTDYARRRVCVPGLLLTLRRASPNRPHKRVDPQRCSAPQPCAVSSPSDSDSRATNMHSPHIHNASQRRCARSIRCPFAAVSAARCRPHPLPLPLPLLCPPSLPLAPPPLSPRLSASSTSLHRVPCVALNMPRESRSSPPWKLSSTRIANLNPPRSDGCCDCIGRSTAP